MRIRIGVFIVATGLVVMLVLSGIRTSTERNLGEAVLSYLAQPEFINRDMLEQVSGVEAKLEIYDLDEGKAYFSMLATKYRGQETLQRLTLRPYLVEFAERGPDSLYLGEYRFHRREYQFFRFPAEDFRVDLDALVRIPYGDVNYEISVGELAAYLRNKNTYGGPLEVVEERRVLGREVVFANHGAFVAKREPSLRRLVERITGKARSKEEVSQLLLAFVSERIQYDFANVMRNVALMKRPSEVLLTGRATCSGKVILYASLLEQVDADYILVYSPGEGNQLKGHIAVCVSGGFQSRNGYTLTLNGKVYHLCETTVPGFRIGEDALAERDIIKGVAFVQKPGGPVVNLQTGQPLKFIVPDKE